MPERLQALTHWLRHELGLPAFDIVPASADASFRRYFRVTFDGESRIVMDAPPAKEDVRPFIRIAGLMSEMGLNVPRVLAESLGQGFLLLSDLGSEPYLHALNGDTAGALYGDALDALVRLQAHAPAGDMLPPYDHALLHREMALFRDWFLERHLGLTLSASEQAVLGKTFERLAASALEQPQVFVHRDYHSRNLMVCDDNPGILDFQDAVLGPISYDLVSLLRDCYIAWPRERVEAWVLAYQQRALDAGVLDEADQERFLRWFDLMGVQRHLKAIGIFARLNRRDGKPGYLRDIPRTLAYVRAISRVHPELYALYNLLGERVEPCTT